MIYGLVSLLYFTIIYNIIRGTKVGKMQTLVPERYTAYGSPGGTFITYDLFLITYYLLVLLISYYLFVITYNLVISSSSNRKSGGFSSRKVVVVEIVVEQ